MHTTVPCCLHSSACSNQEEEIDRGYARDKRAKSALQVGTQGTIPSDKRSKFRFSLGLLPLQPPTLTQVLEEVAHHCSPQLHSSAGDTQTRAPRTQPCIWILTLLPPASHLGPEQGLSGLVPFLTHKPGTVPSPPRLFQGLAEHTTAL